MKAKGLVVFLGLAAALAVTAWLTARPEIRLGPHDGFDLPQHAQAERHPGEQPGGKSPNQARAQHELMACNLGFGRDFLKCGQGQFREAHGRGG